uniref:NADH-ubiquinone oxidoreductase chain 4 n=1 Tax=Folsomotoma octooculata TaxID=1334185 RepID=A0A059PIN4_9HEXA|nr:NADH dehydrogenase subunit 4 [Folsomotoma octooculata]AGL95083.1 NADH dehydrogenase subunit 4 [Folsomotoma octooculata]
MMKYLFMIIMSFFMFVHLLDVLLLKLFILLMISICLMFMFNNIIMDEMLVGYSMVIDSLGFGLILLSIWISMLMVLSSYSIKRFFEFFNYFMFMLVSLLLVLMITFVVDNYMMFYFFFEASLIPTLLIILGWGYQPERLQAGLYFIFYTLTASLPLLLVLIIYYYTMGGFEFYMISESNSMSFIISLLFFLGGVMAFMVKLPMFMTHLWLPKAHVEAPVAGSMILAGVLLKLGGCGLMRLFLMNYPLVLKFSGYMIGLSLMSMVYVGIICCRVNDFKALVAYSSVAHMSMVICGVMGYYIWGYNGSYMMMISHGVSSSGLFCAVNLYYERLGSRSFYINKGLILMFPVLSLMFFMLSAANIAAPPTINLLSEIFLMVSIMGYDFLMILIFPLGSFMGAVFTLFMYSYSQHGKIYNYMYSLTMVNIREVNLMVLHILPVNLLILTPGFFIVL